ncbi:MAG: hypothetical protein WD356_10040 [Pseudomonadales bacterium]
MSKYAMNMDRFEQLLSAYGANAGRWPDNDREQAMEFAATNSRARQLLDEAAILDEALDAWEVDPLQGMKAKILARLPEGNHRDALDRFIDWLLPDLDHVGTWLWRPAFLAGMTLTLGILLGSTVSLDVTDEADLWQEELRVMALNTDTGGSDQ